MGHIRVEVPDDLHTEIKDIKNHNDDRPGTIKECAREALEEYAERYHAAAE